MIGIRTIEEKVNDLINVKSDINEHLKTLCTYAGKGKTVIEFGVRSGVSTWALLNAKPASLISYDITDRFFSDKQNIIDCAAKADLNYNFLIGDTLKIDIANTDMLFIDTLHTYNQLYEELNRHHKNVNEYIVLHDTTTFGFKDEQIYDHASDLVKKQKQPKQGLKNAVNDFLSKEGKQWYIHKEFTNNNGLTILRRKKPVKKVLVAIVNYGDTQLQYLNRIIDELLTIDKFKYTVDIFVHSNIPINRSDVTTIIHETILDDYWDNLPWECRKTIYQKRDDYDLFLYTENDHLFNENHFDAFLKASEILPENIVPGFIQYEEFPEQNLGFSYPAYHGLYDWDYNSLVCYDNYKLAYFSNEHQGGFLLTKKQLTKVISLMGSDFQYDRDRNIPRTNISGYDIKVRCCTDVYTHGGMKKMIPISHFDEFLIHHLPNKYFNFKNSMAFHKNLMQPAIDKILNENNHFSIVIPTLGCKMDYLEKMLEVYNNCHLIKEVIIILNNPDLKIKNKSKKIRTITKGHNIFVNPSWNWGVSEAKYENVIIANDDILINEFDFNILMNKANVRLTDNTIIGVHDTCYTEKTNNIVIESCDNDTIEKRGHGFGTLLFIKKNSFIPINENLKIWFGDDIQFFNNKVFKIKGLFIDTKMSSTIDNPEKSYRKIAQEDCVNYSKYYDSKGKPVLKISFNLATFPARRSKLEIVIASLLAIDIIDKIRVYLNEYTEVPEFLKNNDRIEFVFGKKNILDSGKFFWANSLKDEIYFTGDDDILFTKEYILNHIDLLKKHNNNVFVTNHGRLISENASSFDNPEKTFHFAQYCENDQIINMPGTGVMAFDNSKFTISQDYFNFHGQTDVLIAQYLQENKIPCICRKHEKNEIVSLYFGETNTLFHKHDSFINFQKQVFENNKPWRCFGQNFSVADSMTEKIKIVEKIALNAPKKNNHV